LAGWAAVSARVGAVRAAAGWAVVVAAAAEKMGRAGLAAAREAEAGRAVRAEAMTETADWVAAKAVEAVEAERLAGGSRQVRWRLG